MKTCPVCQRTFKTKNGLKQHMLAAHQRRTPPKAQQPVKPTGGTQLRQGLSLRQQPNNDAVCRVNRTEWLCSVTTDSNSNYSSKTCLEVDGVNLPVLSKLSKLFDRYVVHSISLLYKGSVATTRDGVVYFGIDYDNGAPNSLSAPVVMRYPNKSCPVWTRECVLPLKYDNVVRYVRGNDLRDRLGSAVVAATSDKAKLELGVIYVKYDITLMSLSGDQQLPEVERIKTYTRLFKTVGSVSASSLWNSASQTWVGGLKSLDNALDYISTITSAIADFQTSELYKLLPIDEVLNTLKTVTSSSDPIDIIGVVSMLFSGRWQGDNIPRLYTAKERQVLTFSLVHDYYNLNKGDLIEFQYQVFYTLYKDAATESYGASFKQLNVNYTREWDVVVRKDHHLNNHDHLRAYGSWIVETKDVPRITVQLDLWCVVYDTSGYTWTGNWWSTFGYTYTAMKVMGDIDIRPAISEFQEPDYSLDLRALFHENGPEHWELV